VSALFKSRSRSLSPTLSTEVHVHGANLSDQTDLAGVVGEATSCGNHQHACFGQHDVGVGVVTNEMGLWCGQATPQTSCFGGIGSDYATEEGTAKASLNGKKRRGMHVVDKPEMPQTARDGQHDWQLQRQPLEDEWEGRQVGDNDLFKTQIEKCKLACKNQKLCLLFVLQLFVVDGVIAPSLNEALIDSADDSFFGWTGFRVKEGQGNWFRSRVEAMWPGPNPPRETTLNNAFRRCGFVPTTTWDAAIRGHNDSCFVYKKCKEYKKQRTGNGASRPR